MGMVPPVLVPPQGGSVIARPGYSTAEVHKALMLMAGASYPFPEFEGEGDKEFEGEVYEELFSLSLPDLGWFARFCHNFLAGYDLLLHFLGFHCEPPLGPKREQGYYIMPEREAQS